MAIDGLIERLTHTVNGEGGSPPGELEAIISGAWRKRVRVGGWEGARRHSTNLVPRGFQRKKSHRRNEAFFGDKPLRALANFEPGNYTRAIGREGGGRRLSCCVASKYVSKLA